MSRAEILNLPADMPADADASHLPEAFWNARPALAHIR